jgi:hypothetical protein
MYKNEMYNSTLSRMYKGIAYLITYRVCRWIAREYIHTSLGKALTVHMYASEDGMWIEKRDTKNG